MDMLHISKEDLQVVKVLHYSLLFMQKLIGLLKNSMPTLQNNLI
ncbi:Methyl-accepting chemotaxis protein [Bacillus thuringiensis serovar kurstaki str. T03a001]|nr:Methyl-accepting chemotaxis protein [Bacillus thuringiensis serovar kurstaki str. T03a001]